MKTLFSIRKRLIPAIAFGLLVLLTSFPSVLSSQNTEISFSTVGGFYEHAFYLTLSYPSEGHVIHYTTNGNAPTASSLVYTAPLLLNQDLYSRSDIYTIRNCPDDYWYQPDSVQHCIVVRAAAFDAAGNRVSDVATNSYFIQSLGCDTHGLPVVSLCADSLDLFDFTTGILVPGINYDPNAENPNQTGNYHQHGRDWERVAHMEFFEPNSKAKINQECGLRTHGNRARTAVAKGLKVYAREEYGEKFFKHSFFNTQVSDEYKRLILKPFSDLWPFSGIQDHVCNQLASGLGIDTPQSRPTVLFLNGEYWGIYFLQEKLDERYLEHHYGVDVERCNIIQNWHSNAEEGDATNFNRLMSWLEKKDLSKPKNYNEIGEKIDIGNFLDYLIMETFIANTDWPANNTRCWQVDDSPWKWMFYDGDATLNNDQFDVFGNASYVGDLGWPSSTKASLLFRKLMENDAFRQRIVARTDELLDGIFSYQNTASILASIQDEIKEEIGNQSHRYGYPSSLEYWDYSILVIDGFLRQRPENYRKELAQHIIKVEHELTPDRFTVYPNPASASVSIMMEDELSEATEITICDLHGRLILRQNVSFSACAPFVVEVPVASGIYLIKIGETVKRLVKL